MERGKSWGGWKVDRVTQAGIDAEAKNRAVSALKHGRIGECGYEQEKSLKTPEIESANEHYQERAAMYEFEARINRSKAESMALRDVSVKYGQNVAKLIKESNDER